MLRKGKGRLIIHDLNGSILLDNLSNNKIAEVMNQCEYFICYDLYTMYSRYAVMCGCKSIVVPEPDLSEEDWRPEEVLRYGVAYGFDNLDKAISSTSQLFEYLEFQQNEMQKQVINFVKTCSDFFK